MQALKDVGEISSLLGHTALSWKPRSSGSTPFNFTPFSPAFTWMNKVGNDEPAFNEPIEAE